MSIRAAIYDLLNDSEADVYPLVAPQETTDPYVVFSMTRTPTRTQDGITVNDVMLMLNIYANTLSDCISLADTMYSGLEGTSGTYDSTETLLISNWVSEDGAHLEDKDKYIITQEYQLRFT